MQDIATPDQLYEYLSPSLDRNGFIQLAADAKNRSNYKVFYIPKPNGKSRMIEEPNPILKSIQRGLLKILTKFPLHPAAHGLGGPEKCAVSNAKAHALHRVVIKMDIKQFFPNTWLHQYVYALSSHCPDEYKPILRSIWPMCFIEDVKTNKYRLPTGAPTSPLVSSIAFTPMDYVLAALANAQGLTYTRYIDDLTFSGEEYPEGLQREVSKLVGDYGYAVNHTKSQLLYRGNHTQMITGVCVNEGVGIGKTYKRTLRAEIDKYIKEGRELDEHIYGKLNYVRQLNPAIYEKFQEYFLRRKKHFATIEK